MHQIVPQHGDIWAGDFGLLPFVVFVFCLYLFISFELGRMHNWLITIAMLALPAASFWLSVHGTEWLIAILPLAGPQ